MIPQYPIVSVGVSTMKAAPPEVPRTSSGYPGQQSPAPGAGEVGPHAELGTAYLPHPEDAREGPWQKIQSQFVDDPRGSVERARQLVDELLRCLMTELSDERAALQDQSLDNRQVSTEELRVLLRRYHALYARIAAL